jgi:hypothetical protein
MGSRRVMLLLPGMGGNSTRALVAGSHLLFAEYILDQLEN